MNEADIAAEIAKIEARFAFFTSSRKRQEVPRGPVSGDTSVGATRFEPLQNPEQINHHFSAIRT
jgi:hypothetical protein